MRIDSDLERKLIWRQELGDVSQAKNAAPPLNTIGMMRFVEPGCYANPMAFIVASLCTRVLLSGEVYNERDHVNEGFALYLHDRCQLQSSGHSPGTNVSFLSEWQLMIARYFAFFWSSPWQ